MSHSRRWPALLVVLAALGAAPTRADEPPPAGRDTLKSRLSDKASDEQRVDNCGIPPEKRGFRPRPGCPPERQQPTR
jgi:hypothetical protein